MSLEEILNCQRDRSTVRALEDSPSWKTAVKNVLHPSTTSSNGGNNPQGSVDASESGSGSRDSTVSDLCHISQIFSDWFEEESLYPGTASVGFGLPDSLFVVTATVGCATVFPLPTP